LSTCNNSTEATASIAVYNGSACDAAECLDLIDNDCHESKRSGVAWVALAGMKYYIFLHEFRHAGDFQLKFEQLDPTSAPSTFPSLVPTGAYSSAPSVSMLPTAPTFQPSAMPSSSECILDINISCKVDVSGDACSEFIFDLDLFFIRQNKPWLIQYFETFSWSGNVTLTFNISSPLSGGRMVELKSLLGQTNFAGPLDLSDQVSGETLHPGEIYSVKYGGTLDFSGSNSLSSSWTVTGVASIGEACYGELPVTTFDIAGAGIVGTGITISPTASPQPTTNPTYSQAPTVPLDQTEPCKISAQIKCSDCEVAPSIDTCTSDYPIKLYFQYTGSPCNASTYRGQQITCVDFNTTALLPQYNDEFQKILHIEVEDLTNGVPLYIMPDFNRQLVVPFDHVVQFDIYPNITQPTEIIRITISGAILIDGAWSIEKGGEIYQIIELGTNCGSGLDDINLLTHYGSMQLFGFETLYQGKQIYDAPTFELVVSNIGSTLVETTSFSGPTVGGIDLAQIYRDDQYDPYIYFHQNLTLKDRQFTNKWDTYYKVALDSEETYVFEVGAVNPSNGLSCSSTAILQGPY